MTTHQMSFNGVSSWTASSKQFLVLAIDDDDDNLMLLSYVLELLNCEFVGTTSGHSALTIAQERQPDLILLDVILPDIHGIELVHQLKQDQRTQQIPVIAITGLATSEARTELLSEGFSDYLCKPYMVDDLEAMVQHYLHPSPSSEAQPD